MNTGSRDEQTMLANIDMIARSLSRAASALEKIAGTLDQDVQKLAMEVAAQQNDAPEPRAYINSESTVLVQRRGDELAVSLRVDPDDVWSPPVRVRSH